MTEQALAYPASAVSGARSGISHAAKPGELPEHGWATSYCGRPVSVDHYTDDDGEHPLRAHADVFADVVDGVVVAVGIDCRVCSAAVERWEAQ